MADTPEPSRVLARLKENWVGWLVGVVLAAGLGLGALHPDFQPGRDLIDRSYDQPFHLRHWFVHKPLPDDVVIVYMDEPSYQDLNQSFTAPWDRSLHAKLLDRLTEDHARAVVFDIVFSDPGPDPAKDELFAAAIRRNGKVILAGELAAAPSGYGTDQAMTYFPPYELFRTNAAANGMTQLKQERNYSVRQHFHVWPGDPQFASMTWATARLVGAPVAQELTNRFTPRWMNYYGPPRTLKSFSYFEVLPPPSAGLPIGTFSNKVVFVGAHLLTYNAGERKDEFQTPFTDSPTMSGVEIHATTFLNLLRQDWLTHPTRRADWLGLALLGLLVGLILPLLRPLTAMGVAAALMALLTAFAYALHWQERVWVPWLIGVAFQIPAVLFWSVGFNAFQLYVQKRLFEQTLSLYLSPKLVKKFASRPDLLKPGAEKQTVSILFSDIANFTTLSEGMDSNDLAKLMNGYFETAISRCIFKTDGVVIKYIGDAIFAIWNAPDPQADHAFQACCAALLLRDEVVGFTVGPAKSPLRTRIGLHTGVANVGNFGSVTRFDYTALGESVNLGARMEGLNKYVGTDVLITGDVHAGIGERLLTRPLGNFRLKGFEKAVPVLELIGHPEQAEATRAWREAFAEALAHFQQRRFEPAAAAFQRVLTLKPGDGPCRFLLHQLDEFKLHPPAPEWAGEIELKEK